MKLCPLPWIGLSVRNTGDIRVCCHANVSAGQGLLHDSEGTPLILSANTIKDFRNHPLLKQMRREMMNDRWPTACERCRVEESAGLRSRRIYSNEEHSEVWHQALTATSEDGTIQSENLPFREADLRFGNKCNLACRMCGPTDSSAWYEDFAHLSGTQYKDGGRTLNLQKRTESSAMQVSPNPYQWYESPELWESFVHVARDLRRIYLVGGEPLLIPQHYDLLKLLIERGVAAQLTLEYNTNLTVLPQKVLDLWGQFKSIRIGISLDGVSQINDYIRHPSRFSVIEKNLSLLENLQWPSLSFWFAATVSCYNVWHLPEFVRWSLQRAKLSLRHRSFPLTVHFLHKPDLLSIRWLPPSAQERLACHYEQESKGLSKWVEDLPPQRAEIALLKARKVLGDTLQFMIKNPKPFQQKAFDDFTDRLDKRRGQSFRTLQPEFYEILGQP